MRRWLLVLVAVGLLLPPTVSATLPADTSWEVRPSAGSDLNGACYDTGGSGTDYSQQDAAQLSITDGATTGAGVTTLTSAAAGFTSAMVDNCLHLESGTNVTPGFYEIVTFNSSSSVVLDRAPDNGGGGVASGVGKVGGAAATLEGATTTDITDSLAGGHTVYIKNSGAWNEAVTFTVNAGGAALPIIIEGYDSTRGDNPVSASRPTLDRNSAAGDAINTCTTCENYIIRYLNVREAGDDCISVDDSDNRIESCQLTTCGGRGLNVAAAGDPVAAVLVEASSNTGIGIAVVNDTIGCHNCSSHDNTLDGLLMETGTSTWGLFYDNAADGIDCTTSPCFVVNSTSDGNTGAASDGLETAASESRMTVYNNIFSNNGNYGMNADGSTLAIYTDYNDFNGNSTGARNNVPTGDNDSTADPTFTNAAGDDFSIGTNLKALGIPNTTNNAFPLTDCYTDMGVCQRQEPDAGGAGGWGF